MSVAHSSIISGNVGEDYGEQSIFEVVKGRCPLNPALWVSARTPATPPCWYAQCSQMLFRHCEWTLLHRATMVDGSKTVTKVTLTWCQRRVFKKTVVTSSHAQMCLDPLIKSCSLIDFFVVL